MNINSTTDDRHLSRSAVLTKYTSLRSFVESQRNISPLCYDNVGVYTADLLDAYMDYKLRWKDLNLSESRGEERMG